LSNDGTERFAVFNNGNVTIANNPTDAGFKLDVNGTGRFNTLLKVVAPGNGDGILIESSSGERAPALKLYPKSSSANERNWAISAFRDVQQSLSILSSDSKGGDPYFDGTTRLIIDGISGNVGVGTISPARRLSVHNESGGAGIGLATNLTGTIQTIFFVNNTGSGVNDGYLQLLDNGVAKVSIAANNSRGGATYFNGGGNVLIGTDTDDGDKLVVAGNITLTNGANRRVRIGSATNYYYDIVTTNDDFDIIEAGSTLRLRYDYSATKWEVYAAFNINGALSKSSGSFKIDHPLPSKKDTHKLVHSFVEAPQADNIYRGKVKLIDGRASVNLDEAARMTEGTFVLLNGNVQCFTTNEFGWDNIRGMVNGNILTIESQDPTCSDIVSWIVIGERHDQHMIDTDWTDEKGRVIVEPLIPTKIEKSSIR
jgi:hypothetical protein